MSKGNQAVSLESRAADKRIACSGAMAELVRAHDWSATPMGAIKSWSPTLLASVNLMLCSPNPCALWWGPDLTLLYNDAYQPILSIKHPQSLGQTAPVVWREAWHIIGPQYQDALYRGRITNDRNVMIPIEQNGVMQDCYWINGLVPVYEDGRIAGVYNTCQDVTEAVIAARKLRESEALSSRILRSIGDAVIVTDAGTGITRMNPVAEALTGWSVAEALGVPLSQVFRIVNEETRQTVESPADKVRRLGTIVGLANHTILLRRDGAEVHIDDSGAPIRDDDGELAGIVLVFRDIRERRKTEQALIQSEKLAAVGRLAASIAHEINNPLESVTNLLYLARTSTSFVEVQEYLSTADRELRRVSAITNQTLRFHRQSTSRTEVTCEELIDNVLSIYHGRIVNSRVQVEKRKRAQRPVLCFAGEIRQVLNNLVGNAIDAMHPGGGRMLLRSRESTDWKTGRAGLVITVADTGPGMAAQVVEKAFVPFFTTKGIGGNGLGLWISKEIIGRHQGRIALRSSQCESRSGTVCSVFLPFQTVSP